MGLLFSCIKHPISFNLPFQLLKFSLAVNRLCNI